MGWISGPEEEEKDKFPVDTLVKKLRDIVEKDNIVSVCQDYHGQARKCCDGIRKCFVTLEESFNTVKLQAIGNQDMDRACERLNTDRKATRSCIVSWTANCHGNVNTEQLSEPFHDTLDTLQAELNKTCSDLPDKETTLTTERVSTSTTSRKTSTTTTSTSTTSSTTTTTTKPTTAIFTTTMSSTVLEDTTRQSMTESSQNDVTEELPVTTKSSVPTTDEPGKPNHPNNNRPGPSRESTTSSSTTLHFTPTTEPPTSTRYSSASTIPTSPSLTTSADNSDLEGGNNQGSGSDNTIIIISSAVGGFLFLCVMVLCIIIMYKKRQQSSNESAGSLEPDGKPRFFNWLFKSPKNTGSVQTDTEIYAEIDEAFMEAVYKYDKEKPVPGRDRISSNTQFNMCYESGFNDDDIIKSKDKLNTSENKILPMEPLNPLALIRKDDDAITSFQTDQSKVQEKLSNAKVLPNNKKGFVTRRMGFTDIRPSSSEGEYVYIEAQLNDNVFEDEPNYAVPTFAESEYDTAEYGRNPERNISQEPEQNYYSYLVYKNDPNVQQNVKEYRRSSSDVETHVYENQDTLMEY